MAKASSPPHAGQAISIVVPARNETGNLSALLPELANSLPGTELEIIVVDDASTDATAEEALEARRAGLPVRLLRHSQSAGKSGAILSGVRRARFDLVITVDGDGQNDPQYLPALVAPLIANPDIGVVAGQRTRRGADGLIKRYASRIANRARAGLLKDNTRDTACGLKAFRRGPFLELPHFETMHRFLPALFAADGWQVAHVDVIDRPRAHGSSKYGIWDRLAVGLPDLFGVWWLTRRRRRQAGVTVGEEDGA